MTLALRRRFFADEIEAAQRIRSDGLNQPIGAALAGGPAAWQRVASLRRDAHQPDAPCSLHGDEVCFSTSVLT